MRCRFLPGFLVCALAASSLSAAEDAASAPAESSLVKAFYEETLEDRLVLAPYYWDPAIVTETFTTSACRADWNAEAVSRVWPESREVLVELMPQLKEAVRRDWHLLELIAVFDKADAFALNCSRLKEALRICQMLEVPVALSLYDGEHFVSLEPSYPGIGTDYLLLSGMHYVYIDDAGRSVVADTEKLDDVLPLLSGQESGQAVNIVWRPAAGNVKPLIELVQLLHELGISYTFSLDFD